MPKVSLLATVFLATAFGCSSNADKPWPDLHPARGSVKVGGQTPSGGYLTLRSDDPVLADFIVGGRIESDGSFKLSTTHSMQKDGSQKSGVPAGTYSAQLMPAGGGDQVTGASVDPLKATKPVVVVAGENTLAIEFPKPKK